MKTYACPKCSAPMRKQVGPWCIWYCLPCTVTYDAYDTWGSPMPEPEQIEVEEELVHDATPGSKALTAAFLGEDPCTECGGTGRDGNSSAPCPKCLVNSGERLRDDEEGDLFKNELFEGQRKFFSGFFDDIPFIKRKTRK